jgi:hypothetical protein
MKAPQDMTDNQINHWIEKTSISLNNLSWSQLNHQTAAFQDRLWDLGDRWRELREEMVERGIWIAYCESRGLASDHNAGDCMA